MTKKAKGSITRVGDKWRAKYAGKHLGYYDTYEEAAEAIKAYESLAPESSATKLATLRTFGEGWLDEREKSGLYRSVGRERSCWRAHILTSHFIDWPLKRITQHEIQKWIGLLLKKGAVIAITSGRRQNETRVTDFVPTGGYLQAKTVGNIRHVLKQCFVQAVIEGKLANNPITKEIKTRSKAKVIEDGEETWTYLSPTEISEVFDTVRDPRRRAFYALAIYGGLRQGEIVGIRWRDIVLSKSRPEIKVRRTRDDATKTKHSRRQVPMLHPLYEALVEWKAAWELDAIRGMHSRDAVIDLNRLVIPSDHGGCFADGYDCGWSDRRYRKQKGGPVNGYPGWRSRSGVRPQVTFHCLRHTCASMLIMGGAGFPKLDLFETSKWLGHSSPKVTLRYAHLDPEFLNERIGRMFKFKLADGVRDDD